MFMQRVYLSRRAAVKEPGPETATDYLPASACRTHRSNPRSPACALTPLRGCRSSAGPLAVPR